MAKVEITNLPYALYKVKYAMLISLNRPVGHLLPVGEGHYHKDSPI
jgi:hypothetical protein